MPPPEQPNEEHFGFDDGDDILSKLLSDEPATVGGTSVQPSPIGVEIEQQGIQSTYPLLNCPKPPRRPVVRFSCILGAGVPVPRPVLLSP